MTLEKFASLSFSLSDFSQKKDCYYILSAQEIHVWRANLNLQCDKFLQPEELLIASAIGSPLVRKRFEHSRKTVRCLLSRYLGCAPENIFFQYGDFGKPIIAGFSEISFSIAHSKGEMFLAVSRQPVGVDVELIRSVNFLAIAEKFFSAAELKFLKNRKDQNDSFFDLWTAKEAALKADGIGITRGLRSAFSIIKKNKIAAIDLNKQRWFIHSSRFTIRDDCDIMAAVATSSSDMLIHWYQYE